MTELAAVIGDVVGSRLSADRPALHARLQELLDEANELLSPAVPLRITIGDEFQGCFEHVGQALQATLRLRLAALPDLDLRHGIGWGTVTVLADEPRVEDGPAWWAARSAIEAASAATERPGLRSVRTCYRRADGADGPAEEAVNAALLLRDQLLGGLSERSLSVLRGQMSGRTQREIAADEGISASAVSQRVRNDGLAALMAAEEMLERVR